jgi:hypothetical protein
MHLFAVKSYKIQFKESLFYFLKKMFCLDFELDEWKISIKKQPINTILSCLSREYSSVDADVGV